ncbi:MAG: YihA family ribosome biogenesis GTP-binding protein [Lachnospiraceae bacterium]|nr:YihA family ribosome biogenesis GTP-binding protein [Lachnospiraceae bacterium]
MKITGVNLETVCGITSTIPQTGLPEYAFLGRSNVGKSSLINSLMQRKNYARTSGDPGKTQTVNFYKINDSFYLVDLPGYGYARTSRETRAKWGEMIERYLKTSATLRLVFLLIDSRHAPTQDDKLMLDWLLYYDFPAAILATKVDKLKASRREEELRALRESLKFPADGIFLPYSSVTGEGRDDVYGLLSKL